MQVCGPGPVVQLLGLAQQSVYVEMGQLGLAQGVGRALLPGGGDEALLVLVVALAHYYFYSRMHIIKPGWPLSPVNGCRLADDIIIHIYISG